jgi:O-6-methylguanine DNA methyltransferase
MLEYYGISFRLIGGEKVKKVELDRGKGKPTRWKELKDIRLDLSGFSEFERLVYQRVREIPKGRVSTYKEIACAIGRKTACRGVGNALAKNPFIIVVPCHRVIRSDMRLGGFSKGTEIKKQLLEREGIEFTNNKVKSKYLFRFCHL